MVERILAILLVAVAVSLLVASPAHAETFPVNSTGDEGDANLSDAFCDTDPATPRNQCTLRAAIEEANDTDGADTINFNIDPGFDPGCDSTSKVCTISFVSTTLPDITDPLTIDGYSQGKSTADPADDARPATSTSNAVLKIELSVPTGPIVPSGLKITAANSTIKELVINGWQEGIRIDGSGATGNKVQGNYIGTDKNGTADLGNSHSGVVLFDGAANSTIGGTAAGAANTIAFNGRDGVQVAGSDNTGNRILSNSIHSNGELGIDLAGGDETTFGFGVTKNDTKDPDTGANNLQNFPVFFGATTNPDGTTTLTGKLNSRPKKKVTIQFFRSLVVDPSGFGEGKTFLGQKKVETNKKGNASFAFTTTLPAGEKITATATGSGGTSEFSAPEEAV